MDFVDFILYIEQKEKTPQKKRNLNFLIEYRLHLNLF
jgi:hypothetical protein